MICSFHKNGRWDGSEHEGNREELGKGMVTQSGITTATYTIPALCKKQCVIMYFLGLFYKGH